MKRFVLALTLVLALFSCKKEDGGETVLSDRIVPIENLTLLEEKTAYRFYSFNYPSVDVNGDEVMLSAAMIVPKSNLSQGFSEVTRVLLACHVTIFDREECPSLYPITGKSTEAEGLVKKGKTLIIMPDYEGFGNSAERQHPYLLRDLSGRQCADALFAGLEKYGKLVGKNRAYPLAPAYRTFCMGYSQGAAVALAVQRYLEDEGLDEGVHFKGTVCGGCPSDLIETVKYYIRDDGDSFGVKTRHRKDRLTLPPIMPLLVKCFCDCTSEMRAYSPSDYFSKEFLDCGLLDWVSQRIYSSGTLDRMVFDRCSEGFTAPDGTVYSQADALNLFPEMEKTISGTRVDADLKYMLTSECYAYLSGVDLYQDPGDASGPLPALHRTLLKNSFLGGWTPSHKILLLHSKGDTLISYGNPLSFIERHPGAPVTLEDFSGADHAEAGSAFYLRELFSSSDFDRL